MEDKKAKTFADKHDYENITIDEKIDVIQQGIDDAIMILEFLEEKEICHGRILNSFGHILGALINCKTIDEEDLRNLFRLAIHSGKCYGEIMKDEYKNEFNKESQ